jgi:SAM-dependent methyltransferase
LPETAEQYIDQRFSSAWGSVLHARQLRAIVLAIRLHRVKQVLEIAPGPARLSCQVTGFERGCLCDINVEMLTVARQRLEQARATDHRPPQEGNWQLVVGDAFNLPFNQTFDMVYTFRFIRHFESRERRIIYQQVHSLLKPGGVFIFDAVNTRVALPLRMQEDQANYPIYDELYRREALVKEIEQHGFSILSLKPAMRHMNLQQSIQVYLGPRSYALARWFIHLLEFVPGQPLEWIVVCRKRPMP